MAQPAVVVVSGLDSVGAGDGSVVPVEPRPMVIGIDPRPFATGPMIAAPPEERGYKDTVKVNPGYFTTIRGRFDLPAGVTTEQRYVHHCHIVEHEDNDMMQPFVVTP